jgi:hypothetical protein
MHDASHPERQFTEWVDPAVGRQRDAELCQAHTFGISLGQLLSIQQDGSLHAARDARDSIAPQWVSPR